MRALGPLILALGVAVSATGSRRVAAFCRTQTCPLPADFYPSPTECVPADFASYCASLSTPIVPVPLWWRGAVISYDLQQNASKGLSYDQAAPVVAHAFATWTGTTCTGGGRVSIDVRDLGPVACDEVQYNSDQGNAHLIAFRDDYWPHDDPFNTLALTTITFDHETGEIFDADMEINATVPLSVGDPVPPGGYDFESIVTHEAGHFLGMAHSGDMSATMYYYYAPGSTAQRTLTPDDVGAICSTYLPDHTRSVATTVAPGGKVAEGPADPTPRHGFQSQCARAQGEGCAVSTGPQQVASPWMDAAAGSMLVAAAWARRGRRRVRGDGSREA
ncbi:MAG: matrixin family metalloprotease [Polyangiaceae bacterium]